MSIIKQKSVFGSKHALSLKDYINDDKALLRDAQNLKTGWEDKWFEQMDRTREYIGTRNHNIPSKKGCRNTIIYHQMIGFKPEEADINGGKMTPENCMEYAKEYIHSRYPNQEVVFVLHKEHCAADGTDRYAIHMAINRTNLETGNRLWEGVIPVAKKARIKTIDTLDEKWGLDRVESGKPNSKIHKRQPGRDEREMIGRGGESYKANVRELVSMSRDRTTSFEQFQTKLEEWGVHVEKEYGRVYLRDTDNPQHRMNLTKLDADFTAGKLNKAFKANAEKPQASATAKEVAATVMQRAAVDEARKSYTQVLEQHWKAYVKTARDAEGTPYTEFPKLKVPRRPEILKDDKGIRDRMLELKMNAEKLRSKYASEKPKVAQPRSLHKGGSSSTRETPQQNQQRGKNAPER